MVNLFETQLINTTLQSSKGNQLKWYDGYNWYKADNNGYEGLSEFVVSKLLKKTSLIKDDYVEYEIEEIEYHNRIYLGCKSSNFLKPNQRLITLQRLYQSAYGGEIGDEIDHISNTKEKCCRLVDIVSQLTGIKDFGVYLLDLLKIDALFLNEDRHFHNIAFIEENGKFKNCPIFDNGAALLSDTKLDYLLQDDELKMIKQVKSKTIIEDFDEQLNVLEQMYKSRLTFDFSDQDIIETVNKAVLYNEKIRKRVIRILISQRQRYLYYFN